MPPKKKGEEVKEKPILGRFKSNLKVRGLLFWGKVELERLGWPEQLGGVLAQILSLDRKP